MPKNNYKPEAHAMNKSITQSTQNDKQISKSIKRFFTRFHISSALKAANVLIIDDSMFERNRSKKVELLAKVYDHAKHKYRFGFRMLTLGWSDGSTFLPVNSILLSTESKLPLFYKSAIFSCYINLWEFDHQHTECGLLTTL